MAVNIQFDPSSGSQNQTVKVSGGCNPGIDETIQFQVQTEDGSKTEIINVTQEGKREVLMVSDGQGGYTEFMPSDGGTFNVVKEEWKENPDCGPANGVYVYTVDGELVKPEEWDTANNDQAVGVAVIDTNCQFAISKGLPMQKNMFWPNQLGNVDVEGILTTNLLDDALLDYSGKSNTDLIEQESSNDSSSNNAAYYCQQQILNGKNGYLPASGELYTLYKNKSDIDGVLVSIGSKSISDRGIEINPEYLSFISSTEYSIDSAWGLYWEPLYGEMLHDIFKTASSSEPCAFPFFPLVEAGGVIPDKAPNGVYVYANDGKLYDPNVWDTANNDNAIGVGVVSDNCKFAIDKSLPMVAEIPWSDYLYGKDVEGVLSTRSSTTAQTDYAGQSNTSIIISVDIRGNSSDNVSYYCREQVLNGQYGYLPAAGELAVMYNNMVDIDNVLILIGSQSIIDASGSNEPSFFSSTEISPNSAWTLGLGRGSIHFGEMYKYQGSSGNFVLPFFPFLQTGSNKPITTYFVDSGPNIELSQHGSTDKSWIVGRRCLAKKTDNGVAICYLDANNSKLFHDGVTPATLDGAMGQWMTDIPEYYFNVDESVEGTHKFQVLPTEQADWKKSRRVLLGVTKGVIRNGKLWSISGKKPTVSNNIRTFHNNAVACGDGFDIIDYETHCKLAHLFYTKYANRNPQEMSQFGTGSDTTGRTSGETASLGNNDGKSRNQVAFLGVEDPYGNVEEFMGGIHRNGQTYYIYDGFEPNQIPTVPYREYTTQLTTQNGYISKVEWGEYGDMIPTDLSGAYSTYYCDFGYYIGSSGWRVVYRSGASSKDSSGFSYFRGDYSSSSTSSNTGSRLQYRGNIEVIDDPATFIAMPVGF